LVTGSVPERKFLFTILTLSRALKSDTKTIKKLEAEVRFDTITDKNNSKKIIPTGFIKSFVRSFRLKSQTPVFDKKDIYLSNKSGPNGKSTLTAMLSLYHHGYTGLQDLFNLTDSAGVDYLTKQFNHVWEN
jgi:hypothetical protein